MEGAFGCSSITSLCDSCDHKCERYEGYNQALDSAKEFFVNHIFDNKDKHIVRNYVCEQLEKMKK